ncbi:MAG TPA: hypothetical protein VFT22_33625, partial [Kofleriaceae bacterium]|nr:hypothetical protein [Kofleriaceae bacterium]
AMSAVRSALDAILRQQEPFPAVVMNRYWDVLRTNDAGARFFGFLRDLRPAAGPANVLRMMFDPDALRPFVTNWEAVAQSLIRRLHREAVGGVADDTTMKLLADLLRYPGVPSAWRDPGPSTALVPVVPVSFRKAEHTFHFFSTVTTLGTPQDIVAQEIRIECFFPVDASTTRAARWLATATESPPG